MSEATLGLPEEARIDADVAATGATAEEALVAALALVRPPWRLDGGSDVSIVPVWTRGHEEWRPVTAVVCRSGLPPGEWRLSHWEATLTVETDAGLLDAALAEEAAR